ncbi:hypothetical protein PPERSA_04786 [Pseudocohnilembus persalinus]|uniref:Uncharacterized protein n=1 Tax=Pseudocohnilembus persalinus TaxID=266149 RepID=A0A0V0Q9K3_PSEPJ|nr:hypothetical protein PPERSA_04786 [Pseudocohnilembus persalinus]|eukprot:KRW98853.1 hypothetical protein PPERSA_04786 [Pseudocohnilembus persalinus]
MSEEEEEEINIEIISESGENIVNSDEENDNQQQNNNENNKNNINEQMKSVNNTDLNKDNSSQMSQDKQQIQSIPDNQEQKIDEKQKQQEVIESNQKSSSQSQISENKSQEKLNAHQNDGQDEQNKSISFSEENYSEDDIDYSEKLFPITKVINGKQVVSGLVTFQERTPSQFYQNELIQSYLEAIQPLHLNPPKVYLMDFNLQNQNDNVEKTEQNLQNQNIVKNQEKQEDNNNKDNQHINKKRTFSDFEKLNQIYSFDYMQNSKAYYNLEKQYSKEEQNMLQKSLFYNQFGIWVEEQVLEFRELFQQWLINFQELIIEEYQEKGQAIVKLFFTYMRLMISSKNQKSIIEKHILKGFKNHLNLEDYNQFIKNNGIHLKPPRYNEKKLDCPKIQPGYQQPQLQLSKIKVKEQYKIDFKKLDTQFIFEPQQ